MQEGILFRRRAEKILQLVGKTEKELIEQEEQVEGKIAIGCGEISSVRSCCYVGSAAYEQRLIVVCVCSLRSDVTVSMCRTELKFKRKNAIIFIFMGAHASTKEKIFKGYP